MENGIKVIVATDFSAAAENAFKYAVHFLNRFKSDITILNVYKAFQITTEVPVENLIKEETERIKAESYQHLEKDCRYVKDKFPDTPCHTIAIEDIPEHGISTTALDQDTDLIVIGVKRRNVIERMFVGNTAAKVFSKAKCPVLVVPDGCAFDNIINIVYASGYSDREIPKINQLTALAKAFDARITVINVSEEDKEKRDIALENFKRTAEEVIAYKQIDWISVHGKDKVKTLQKVVTDKHADILVLSAHSPVFMENLYRDSITEEVLNKLTLPLLVFHLDREDE